MEPDFPPVAVVFDLATHLGAVGTVGHLLVCVDLSSLGFCVRHSGWCKQSVFFCQSTLEKRAQSAALTL